MGQQGFDVDFASNEKRGSDQPEALAEIEDQDFADEMRCGEALADIQQAGPIRRGSGVIPIESFRFGGRMFFGQLEKSAFADKFTGTMLSKR